MSSIKEKKIKGNINYVSVTKLKEYLETLEKCVCKIISGEVGSGFFCKLIIKEFSDIQRPFLITNNHVINEDFLNSQNILKIKVNKKEKLLNLKNRIKLTDVKKDFTLIEIKNFDKIYNFLEVCPDIMKDSFKENIAKTEIIIPQFPENELSVSFGTITGKNEEDIYYNASTDYGSSGSPILLFNNFQIIGIHKQRQINANLNGGTFIRDILESIEEMKNLRNINILKEQQELNISKLELINSIKCDNDYFREIIILKDGRLCSMDEKSNINIYSKINFKVEIEINYSSLPDTYIKLINDEGFTLYKNYYKLGCTNDNELFFYAKNCIFIVLINKYEYEIIQQFPFEHFNCPNLYLYENNIILSDYNNLKEYEKKENKYKLVNEYISNNCADSSGTLYKEKFKFQDSTIIINNWTNRQWIFLDKINKLNDEKKDGFCFPGLFHKNQKVFISPSHLILGDYESLISLEKYVHKIDDEIIQKIAFNKKDNSIHTDYFDRKNNVNYENLSNSSFIYLRGDTFLSQINIIDFSVNARREDIRGNFFIRKEELLFILSGNKINVYHF